MIEPLNGVESVAEGGLDGFSMENGFMQGVVAHCGDGLGDIAERPQVDICPPMVSPVANRYSALSKTVPPDLAAYLGRKLLKLGESGGVGGHPDVWRCREELSPHQAANPPDNVGYLTSKFRLTNREDQCPAC